MQHIIQIRIVQITTVYTVAYQLCLVTVTFNSETQLFFSHANSLKKPFWIFHGRYLPCPGAVFLTNVWGFLKLEQDQSQLSGRQVVGACQPFLWNIFLSPSSPSPLLFPTGGRRASMLSFFDSVWIWPRVSRKRSQTCFLSGPGGNSVISKGRVVKNNWAI